MSKIQAPKRIRVEDFKSEEQDLVSKIGQSINTFQDAVYSAFQNGINFDNLARQLSTITVQTDATSKVRGDSQIKLIIQSKPVGISVVRVINLTNPSVYPTSHPFLSWSLNDSLIIINNISGLPPSAQLQLTIEIIA